MVISQFPGHDSVVIEEGGKGDSEIPTCGDWKTPDGQNFQLYVEVVT